jgi:hypothetical protein
LERLKKNHNSNIDSDSKMANFRNYPITADQILDLSKIFLSRNQNDFVEFCMFTLEMTEREAMLVWQTFDVCLGVSSGIVVNTLKELKLETETFAEVKPSCRSCFWQEGGRCYQGNSEIDTGGISTKLAVEWCKNYENKSTMIRKLF